MIIISVPVPSPMLGSAFDRVHLTRWQFLAEAGSVKVENRPNPASGPRTLFLGDRYGQVTDPFGRHWSLASRQEDLTADEVAKNAQKSLLAAAAPRIAPKPDYLFS